MTENNESLERTAAKLGGRWLVEGTAPLNAENSRSARVKTNHAM